jgi:hypothetical protein
VSGETINILFILFFVGFVAFTLVKAGWGIYKARKSEAWPAAKCVILSSSVESKRVSSGKGGSRTVYQPRIRYTYNVNGRDFQGDKVTFFQAYVGNGESRAGETCYRYQVDSVHDVYYNPDKPAESVLEPGIDVEPASILLFLLVVLFIGFILWQIITAGPNAPLANSRFHGP